MNAFGALMGGITPAQMPQMPAGCTGSCEATVLASGVPVLNAALGVLAGVIGTYGFIEQIKLQRRMTRLAERAADKADEFYAKSRSSYDTHALPTWQRMRDLYDRYVSKQPYEDKFINCAFALREYCPDTVGEVALATGRVGSLLSRADAQRRRLSGRACASAACHHPSYMAAMTALLKSSAGSAATQFEEDRKRTLDQWYWQRWKDGANLVLALGDRGVKAILAGAANINAGLKGIGDATAMYQQAAAGQAGAIANAAQFWGGIASGGLNGFGQAVGAGYFNSAPDTGGWTTTTTVSAIPSTGGYVSYK